MKKFLRSRGEFALPDALLNGAIVDTFDTDLLRDAISTYLPDAKDVVLSTEQKLEVLKYSDDTGMGWIPFDKGLEHLNDKFLLHVFVLFEVGADENLPVDYFGDFIHAISTNFPEYHRVGYYFKNFGVDLESGAREVAMYLRIYKTSEWPCIGHSELLVGHPIGSYHCFLCGQLQMAGLPHRPIENGEGEYV